MDYLLIADLIRSANLWGHTGNEKKQACFDLFEKGRIYSAFEVHLSNFKRYTGKAARGKVILLFV